MAEFNPYAVLCMIGEDEKKCSCQLGRGAWCKRCGFNRDEYERRKALPLVKDPRTGLHTKFVGLPKYEDDE